MDFDKNFFLKKKIILGITGSIAAYKAANICSNLVRLGAEVYPAMTENALNFINPITFNSLSGHRTITSQFDDSEKIYHISLSHSADIILIAPATANIIARLANCIGDDFITTVSISALCPILIAPAMNHAMYSNKLVQENISKLKSMGKFFFSGPGSGKLACGEQGEGRLEDEDLIIRRLGELLVYSKELSGKKVIITAGGTREYIDPVRFLSNKSSGKMGYALAEEASFRGAGEVILVSTVRALPVPYGASIRYVENTQEMKMAVMGSFDEADIIIMAAAVSDVIPEKRYGNKLSKKDDILSKFKFKENENILSQLAENKKSGQLLIGFAAQSGYNVKDILEKIKDLNIDMIVANDISRPGIGMESDFNEVSIIKKSGQETKIDYDRKRMIARKIWDNIINYKICI